MKFIIKDKRRSFTITFNKKIDCYYLSNGSKLVIDGYITPRMGIYEEYSKFNQFELVDVLIQKYDKKFINYIKGVFNILIFDEKTFDIYNDRHSIKKFFIYQNGDHWLISNNLEQISDVVDLELDKTSAVMFCLMEHFIDGNTLFKNVRYSKAATVVSFYSKLNIGNYWSADELLDLPIKNYSYEFLANYWKDLIANYIHYLKPKSHTMTLTGGNDSRMILAALLSLGERINAFSFGNPNSFDVVIAKELSYITGINYNNYFVENPTESWFAEYADKIINIGDSLINIHRAHRLDAIEKEIANNPNVEMIFGGFMGGDYLKGIVYDDYITAEIIRLFEFENVTKSEAILRMLGGKNIKTNRDLTKSLLKKINSQNFIKSENKSSREFYYVNEVVGCLHDTQDTNVFNSKIKYAINPYMDIDFLKIIFSSKHCMLYKNNSSKNQLKRLNQNSLHINITNLLAPQISKIFYAKKGFYTAEEFLGNKVIFFFKRFSRFVTNYKVYPANFPYGEWFSNYSKSRITKVSGPIREIFDFHKITNDLDNGNHAGNEKYWHRFTNLINLDMIFRNYRSKS